MTQFAKENYENLMKLVEKDEAFHYKDFTLDSKVYRIFNYRLASWTSFQEPNALNCRGIMFDISDEANVKLVSLPPEKFFNYEEGGIDHTIGRLGDKMIKMDGSLISTYEHNGDIYLKSKASLFSSQANVSMAFLNAPENALFKEEVARLVKQGYTVNMEYTSPENRVVIPYQKEELTVLSVRSNETGENFFASKLARLLEAKGGFTHITEHLVKFEDLRDFTGTHSKFVEAVREEQEGEGYVIEIEVNEKESYLVKVKNLKYIALHQTKDSVNSSRRLFEAIINEASDDLRSMFADDAYVLNKIAEMEAQVQPVYNHIIKTVEDFHAENKDLARKDYAIKATKDHPEFMGLLMNSYLGKTNNYKEFAIKHRTDLFRIKDEELELDDDGNVIGKKAGMTP